MRGTQIPTGINVFRCWVVHICNGQFPRGTCNKNIFLRKTLTFHLSSHTCDKITLT